MKVCRYEQGNTSIFTCPYHSWTYTTDGKLQGVPQYRSLYDAQLDRDANSLVAVAKLAIYKGTIQFAGDKPKTVEGQITIRGVARPATLSINLFNCMPHPMLKKEVCGADAEGELNWSEYGMKMSQYGQGDAGKVHLRIQVEAIKD